MAGAAGVRSKFWSVLDICAGGCWHAHIMFGEQKTASWHHSSGCAAQITCHTQQNMPHLHDESKAVSIGSTNIDDLEGVGHAEAARHVDGISPA